MKKSKLLASFVIPIMMFSSCSTNKTTTSTSLLREIEYTVEYYFESLSGEYLINNSLTITNSEEIGTKINADIKTVEGFTYDDKNTNNKISETLSEDSHTLSVYYSRNDYHITVYGGTASKEVAKYEETVTITPNVNNSEITLEANSKATLNGNQLTVGAEDVVVKCLSQSKLVLSSSCFTDTKNFNVQVDINISNSSNIEGLVFLYNSQNMSDDGDVKYYLFGILNGSAGLFMFHNGVLDLIKQTTFSIGGTHTLGVIVDYISTIKCYIDGINAFNATQEEIINAGLIPIATGGKIGVYSNNYIFSFSNLTLNSGGLSLEEVKSYFINAISVFAFSKHVFDTASYQVVEGEVNVDLSIEPKYAETIQQFENNINSANSLEALDTALAGAFQYKLASQKNYTNDYLYQLLYDIHFGTFMFYVETKTTTYFDTGITLSRDYLARDLRTFVPDAYKLRGAEGKICLLDQLDIDLAKAKNSREVYAISDTYALDLVKALCYRDYEYCFWENYNKYLGSTFPVWDWFLYNYYGASGNGFVYTGNVFPNYKWTSDFRLNRFIFGTTDNGGLTDIYNIVNTSNYMIQKQIIQARQYTVTLNADGGQLSSYSLSGNSSAALALPTPTKEGYVFDGWYLSRLLSGNKYTSIPAENLKDLTLYAAYKKDGQRVTSDILPAEYITENMIIQQNKPVVISGTGKNGLSVTVSFNGTNQTTIVAEGKWKVVFPAEAASFAKKTITITSDNIVYTFNNVLVGEVWLGAGQSNMEMLPTWLNGRGGKYVGEIGSFTNFEKIRIFRQYVDDLPDYAENLLQNRWVAPSRTEDLFDKSFLSITFACYLQEKLNVPVGILTSARGGTYIEEWLSEESLNIAGSTLSPSEQSLKSRYYNSMTVDLKDMQINGVIWYQGENNYLYPNEYKAQFKELVKQFREIFNDDELVIITQQLVQYADTDFKGVRLAQWQLMKEIENTYCSCAIDEGEEHDIHPADKFTLGSRLSDIACEYVYHIGSDSLSYEPISASIENNKIAISFENGKTIHSDEPLNHFKVEKLDGSFVNVSAEIVNNKIIIDNVENARKVHYANEAWLGEITLYGGNNKPVVPFVIDIA